MISEANKSDSDITVHLQALEQALNSFNPRSMMDKRNVNIAKMHLKHIKAISRKNAAQMESLRETQDTE
jgi:hypothetical protein